VHVAFCVSCAVCIGVDDTRTSLSSSSCGGMPTHRKRKSLRCKNAFSLKAGQSTTEKHITKAA
jgi:hypothetical protein